MLQNIIDIGRILIVGSLYFFFANYTALSKLVFRFGLSTIIALAM